ncbi:hypothetical protein A0H81_09048 [Grifola frondosa]|uniref:Uncharacterized protein n=1 Tax=Grifola frondosa TaxID=5627 RepID=A0A1C7M257_GRIFR|nr:hypothetical protein A0H81_09048 [Grifola frondosa]
MEVLSLKLSEAVSKALAQPNGPPVPHELLAGRRPIPPGRGRSLGALIASEIKASRENPHLYRAIIRTLQRPLSVLLTNLSSNLLPLLSSPLFLTPPSPTIPSPHLNATQLHAVGLATLAGELLEAFDEIGLGIDIDTRGESLKTIREGLVSIVKRVVDPLTTSIKNELTPVIEALESAPPPCSSAHTAGAKGSGGTKSPVAHPSIMTLQTVMPVYARALTRIIASASAESSRGPTVAADAHAFYALLSLLPRPSGDKESTRLAHEAVDEAFEGLSALVTLLDAIQSHMSIRNRPSVPGAPATPVLMELEHDLEALTADLPLLIALPILLRTYCAGERHVTAMLGLSEVEYRKGCLGGYGRAEECAVAVGQRVLDVLQAEARLLR